MSQVFNTQTMLQLKLDTGINISAATVKKILYKKPGNTGSGEWTVSTIDGTNLVYDVQLTDITAPGEWQFQAFVTVGGKDGYGKIVKQMVTQKLN